MKLNYFFKNQCPSYLSCPAVSQISNLTVVSSRQTVCVRKAAPMVLSWYSWNCPLTNLKTRLDLPTALSPNSTNLNWHILPCVDPLGLCAVPDLFAIVSASILILKMENVYYTLAEKSSFCGCSFVNL